MMSELQIILVVAHIVVITWALLSRRHLNGLLGGYGKGRWAGSSNYMMDARSSFATSTGWLAVLIIIDLVVALA